jgi:hypothetical protein
MNSRSATSIFLFALFIHVASRANEAPTPLSNDTWQKLNSLIGVKVGNASNAVQLIVLFDANCPFSARLWSHLYVEGSPHRKLPPYERRSPTSTKIVQEKPQVC